MRCRCSRKDRVAPRRVTIVLSIRWVTMSILNTQHRSPDHRSPEINQLVLQAQQVMVAPLSTTTNKTQQGAFHSITPAQLHRPSSQATSVKAEPGSNVAPSDTSKKEVPDSPTASQTGEGYTSDQPSNPTNTKVGQTYK